MFLLHSLILWATSYKQGTIQVSSLLSHKEEAGHSTQVVKQRPMLPDEAVLKINQTPGPYLKPSGNHKLDSIIYLMRWGIGEAKDAV